MTNWNEQSLRRIGDDVRNTIAARMGVASKMLVCPREKSDMTPCVARDGGVSVIRAAGFGATVSKGSPICVGCEASVERMLTDEREKR